MSESRAAWAAAHVCGVGELAPPRGGGPCSDPVRLQAFERGEVFSVLCSREDTRRGRRGGRRAGRPAGRPAARWDGRRRSFPVPAGLAQVASAPFLRARHTFVTRECPLDFFILGFRIRF